MGLFSKKEDVPKIPSAPSLPELPKSTVEPEKKNLPELPSFPPSPKNEGFNQEMVKSAVGDDSSLGEKESEVGIPEIPKTAEATGAGIPPRPFAAPTTPAFPVPSTPSSEIDSLPKVAARPAPRDNEPIFVRIDKFQSSQKNFDDIKARVGEIESVLQKIKEVKVREEEELKNWTEDVEKIKLKLGEIDADIFSQI